MALFGQGGKGKGLDQLGSLEQLLRPESKSPELIQLSEKFDALLLLLKKRFEISEQEFEAALSELRQQRAEAATQSAGSPSQRPAAGPCPTCGRARSAKTGLCPYCGADKEALAEIRKRFESQ